MSTTASNKKPIVCANLWFLKTWFSKSSLDISCMHRPAFSFIPHMIELEATMRPIALSLGASLLTRDARMSAFWEGCLAELRRQARFPELGEEVRFSDLRWKIRFPELWGEVCFPMLWEEDCFPELGGEFRSPELLGFRFFWLPKLLSTSSSSMEMSSSSTW